MEQLPLDYGLCQCGCGQRTPLAPYSHAPRGWRIREPIPFVHGHNRRKSLDYVVDGDGCWILTAHERERGYQMGTIEGKPVLFHRVFWERHRGPIPHGAHLHHVCENPRCVNPDHLELLSPREHRRRHAKLTVDDVRAIRRSAAQGTATSQLAVSYNCTAANIHAVVTRRSWKDID